MDDTTKRWLDEHERQRCEYAAICHHNGYRYQEIDRVLAIIARLCSRLDAQQEVIDKLPRTKDDCPVVPEIDYVYSPSGRRHKVLLDKHGKEPVYYVPEAMNIDGEWRDLLVSDCYSTRAAAEAAHRGADAAPTSAKGQAND